MKTPTNIHRELARRAWLPCSLNALEILLKGDSKRPFLQRTINALENKGIFTISDLLCCTETYLLNITNISVKTMDFLYKLLEQIGFTRNSRLSDPKYQEPAAIPLPKKE